MGCGAGSELRQAAPGLDPTLHDAGKSSTLLGKAGDIPWQLPEGGCVVALHDFDPSSMHWPERWGTPLPLVTSWLVQVTCDVGSELVFGHLVKQPEKQGYFLKHYAMPLADCIQPVKDTYLWRDCSRSGSDEPFNHADDVGDTISGAGPKPWHKGKPTRSEETSGQGYVPDATRKAQFLWAQRDRDRTVEDFRQYAPEALKRMQVGPQLPVRLPERGPGCQGPRARGRDDGGEASPSASAGPACQASGLHTETTFGSEAEMVAARALRLRPEADEAFMWVASHAAVVELPADWEELADDEGRRAYYHPATKRVSRQHPMMVKYEHFLRKLRAFHQRTNLPAAKVRPHIAVILNELLNRCNRELPPVTPEIVERVAVLLNIDTSIDHRLTSKLKLFVESYVEDQYDISVQVHEKADIDAFLAKMRQVQVEMEVISKPDVVIMCSEIDGLPACIKCDQCMDYFSLEGFAKTHVAGKRKLHTTVKCEQIVCSAYPHEFATCEVDGVRFCDAAYEEAATRNPALRQKRKKILGGLLCSAYQGKRADVLCEDCSDMFCWEAFIEYHNHGSRRHHVALQFDASYSLLRGGVPLPPEETAKLLSRSKLASEGGPWLAFRDDQLNTYWYHLNDKVTTRENPYL